MYRPLYIDLPQVITLIVILSTTRKSFLYQNYVIPINAAVITITVTVTKVSTSIFIVKVLIKVDVPRAYKFTKGPWSR